MKTFRKIKKTFGFTKKETVKHNLDAVAFYDNAKKWGKTKRTDSIIEKYRKNGKVIENNCLLFLSVIDVPGMPLCVQEEKYLPRKTYYHFDLENGWTAAKNNENGWNICHSCDYDIPAETLANVITFANQHGIPLKLEPLKYHIRALQCGFKAQMRISPEWVMFSPIIENGIILRFYRDAEAKSYIV